MTDSPATDGTLRDLLRQRDFVFFWFSRWTAVLGVQIQSVALGWHIYDIARRTMPVNEAAFMVSMIGLVSFIPVLLLALPAGETADRHNRRRILLACYAVEVLVAAISVGQVVDQVIQPRLMGSIVGLQPAWLLICLPLVLLLLPIRRLASLPSFAAPCGVYCVIDREMLRQIPE